ncbi:GntR family transcriptional regulator [Croceicoccus bisphenolivorans]|uniref:GntR family transcriptional regulator n=1 Tax=Croceicoccus bisphenolivorans TaxID=1783232 RepID=UPI000834683B|nr:GntR family transcriptional regulator [Croceicoccus bisphenolivorans]
MNQPDGKDDIRSGRTREVVVRDIIQGLYDGRYEPGQRIYEAQLTAAHGISRGPVREALNALAAMNIVSLVPQKGAQVRVLGVDEAIETLVVAQTLIALAARLAAESNRDGPAFARFQEAARALQRFKSGDSTNSDYAVARDSFYGALTALASNAELSRVLPTVRVHLIRTQFRSILRADDATWLRDYGRIADAVMAGQAKAAEAAARTHISRAISRLQDFQNQ